VKGLRPYYRECARSRLKPVKGPALDGCPEATSSIFEMGRTTMHASKGLLQVQPDKTLGKTLPFTSPTARTLSTMWPEWTLKG
jgi:hypothetical protein